MDENTLTAIVIIGQFVFGAFVLWLFMRDDE